MIRGLVYLAVCLITISSKAQDTTASTPSTEQPAPADAQGTSALTFKDGAGQSFSADQLANQLQNLRNAVDQTLPLLAAFNQNVSNSVGGRNETVRDAISGILSGAENKNTQRSPPPSGQSSFSVSNVVGTLEGLLKTKHGGTMPANQSTVRDLATLENSLQPVASILQNLNVSGISTNQFARPTPGR
jgi:hypothetical protein